MNPSLVVSTWALIAAGLVLFGSEGGAGASVGVGTREARTRSRILVMTQRGYMLVDVPVYERFWPDQDLIVGVMEFVRSILHSLEPSIPSLCEIDLIAGGTAHNPPECLLPLLGLYTPPQVPVETVPDWLHLNGVAESWCEGLTDEELKSLGRSAGAPSWAELQASRVHPARRDDD